MVQLEQAKVCKEGLDLELLLIERVLMCQLANKINQLDILILELGSLSLKVSIMAFSSHSLVPTEILPVHMETNILTGL